MANSQRGEVAWSGSQLRCSMTAMAELEDEFDQPFIGLIEQELAKGRLIRMKTLARIIRPMIQPTDGAGMPDLDQVYTLIDDAGVSATIDAVGQAVRLTFSMADPDQGADQDDTAPPPPAADGA